MEFEQPHAAACEVELLAHAHQTPGTTFVVGHFRPTWPVLLAGPSRLNPHLYRARNLVERFFNKIKRCRRVATRYDKLAANYLAFVQLASIRLWLRVNESTS